jgi:division protein CdvB (Snf7/Vps24/ESCRT-III family)
LLFEENKRKDEELYNLKSEFDKLRAEKLKIEELISKLQDCQTALKESLLNSLVCIDFYKDLE